VRNQTTKKASQTNQPIKSIQSIQLTTTKQMRKNDNIKNILENIQYRIKKFYTTAQ